MTGVDPKRSVLMSRVKGKNTKPEMAVRQMVHALGYRYRLHRADLPGSPDLAFSSRKKVIFVHGCFWHRHAGCRRTTAPKTRAEFWQSKFDANVARDTRNTAALRSAGWGVLVVWECETTDVATLRTILCRFLENESVAGDGNTGIAVTVPSHPRLFPNTPNSSGSLPVSS